MLGLCHEFVRFSSCQMKYSHLLALTFVPLQPGHRGTDEMASQISSDPTKASL